MQFIKDLWQEVYSFCLDSVKTAFGPSKNETTQNEGGNSTTYRYDDPETNEFHGQIVKTNQNK